MRLSSVWQVFSANSKQERSGKSRESKVRLKRTASSMQRSVERRKKRRATLAEKPRSVGQKLRNRWAKLSTS